MGTTQMGKSPAIPPPIWKKPMEDSADVFVYQSASEIIYSMPVLTVCTFLILPEIQWLAYMFPSVESSQPGTKTGIPFPSLRRASYRQHPLGNSFGAQASAGYGRRTH